jgi:hypothetical protein
VGNTLKLRSREIAESMPNVCWGSQVTINTHQEKQEDHPPSQRNGYHELNDCMPILGLKANMMQAVYQEQRPLVPVLCGVSTIRS